MKPKTVLLYASQRGEKGVYERLPVIELDTHHVRLACSPSLVLGVAKGDIIQIAGESGRYRLIRRSGNVAIQLFVLPSMSKAVDALADKVKVELNGTIDGKSPKQAVFTVHISRGFDEIERIFDEFVRHNDGAAWFYGNVYDPDDYETPLNWWTEKLDEMEGGAFQSPREWDRFLDETLGELQAKNDRYTTQFGLVAGQRWHLDLYEAELIWFLNDTPTVRAEIQCVGSISHQEGTWLWSWANDHIPPHSKERMESVRRFGEENGLAQLTDAKWQAEESDGEAMTAVAAHILGAEGFFQDKADDLSTYMLITRIEKVTPS